MSISAIELTNLRLSHDFNFLLPTTWVRSNNTVSHFVNEDRLTLPTKFNSSLCTGQIDDCTAKTWVQISGLQRLKLYAFLSNCAALWSSFPSGCRLERAAVPPPHHHPRSSAFRVLHEQLNLLELLFLKMETRSHSMDS